MALLGTRVRAIREQRGLTQDQLGRASGVRRSHISRLETGQRENPSVDITARLAVALDTSTDYLMGLTDDPRPVREVIHPSSDYSVLADQAYQLMLQVPPERQHEILALLRAMVTNLPSPDS